MRLRMNNRRSLDRTMTRKQVLEHLRRKQPLEQGDMRGLDLSGISFDGVNLRDAKMAGANLTSCSFRSADLSGASLWQSDLQGATLDGANLEGADLDMANLDGCSFLGARLRKTILPDDDPVPSQVLDSVRSGRRVSMPLGPNSVDD